MLICLVFECTICIRQQFTIYSGIVGHIQGKSVAFRDGNRFKALSTLANVSFTTQPPFSTIK